MDEMEFTEAESNMQDLVAEYQQCEFAPAFPFSLREISKLTSLNPCSRRKTDQEAGVDDEEFEEEGVYEEEA